ncbi:hypothetical protein D8B26_001486 [Coccidioides posadasii str. Silveira]|uniref:Vacuolar sorting protein 4b n=2 Tax=Coccidioides posadasii TaxID=199306 RepID=E9CVC7_COCPS|nr:ATPase, AAA family protein [Coccidioides posadasii C735 delta SOWgp]EER23384.1 ATPase, AAA family protein [Coccidioides posadasii C735 delta SOWgp]EFW21265.1 vacuolar sorting protein 4b [Coccidioides posadasii str. Silveira]QVM06781.1 hypothetical protein D8B26_001486 [Coccidioides posadasii str. Silveira]|eukprot:XP_003065529.1 ATPase, AAA family protein [Coccidioides posadasii C735 delta SOWgp]
MLRSSPGSLMQKTYDECYLMCSTAVYFEGRNNEQEALRSWRESLDTIYRHNASISSSYVPQNETERALQKSIQELETQCKERIDLLEALRESRRTALLEEGKDKSGLRGESSMGTTHADTGQGIPSPGWIGDGTVPSLGYPDLPRPALPPRPQARNTNRVANAVTPSKLSRSASSEERTVLLPTLRGSKDKKSPEMRDKNSRRVSRPAASQAADLAWSALHSRPSGPHMTHSTPVSDSTSRKWVDSSLRPDARPRKLGNPAVNLASGAAAAATRRPAEPESLPEDSNTSARSYRNPDTTDALSAKAATISKLGAPASAYPKYRKEYPESGNTLSSGPVTPQAKASSNSARKGPESQPGTSPGQPPAADGTPLFKPPSSGQKNEKARRPGGKGHNDNSARQNISHEQSHSATSSPVQPKKDSSPLPPETPRNQVESSDDEDPFAEEIRTDKDFCNIMKNLPKGVDRNAAGQILNEIVVRGDEVHWDDIAGLEIAKKALKEAVVYPFLRPDLFMGLREPARGMLLFGPPGTGKTMLARAVATESKSTFFSISATSLTSKWHGESEKLVRALFALAKAMAPSIIFVDEIDSLLSSRLSGDHDATRRSKTQFLVEWSDLQRAAAGREQSTKEKAEGDATRVLVLGATNVPWDIDDAARRRFVRRQYIPLPEDDVRKLQLQKLLSHQKHELSEEDIDVLVKVTDGFSGSDITALAKDAAMGPLRNLGEALLSTPMDEICPIRFKDFESSLYSIRPSVSRERLKEYESWARDYGERGS